MQTSTDSGGGRSRRPSVMAWPCDLAQLAEEGVVQEVAGVVRLTREVELWDGERWTTLFPGLVDRAYLARFEWMKPLP